MKVLLAVSGGADSMYLASRAPELFPGSSFAVAHFNFRLRGKESDADEEFVRIWCRKNGLECICTPFDTEEYAASNGVSIEMAARDLRYTKLAEICREYGFNAVAVAHNANDNAETLILNLLRGTSGRGMRGMRSIGKVPGADDIPLLRPMLATSRKEITDWLQSHGVEWREDRTNAETLYRRNMIRHRVLPVFSEINPSFLSAISRTMEHLSQENDIANDYFIENRDIVFSDGRIDITALKGLKHWKFILFRLLEPYGVNFQNMESISEMIEKDNFRSGKTFYGDGVRIVSSNGGLIISEATARNDVDIPIDGPGEYMFDGYAITIREEILERGAPLAQKDGQTILSRTSLHFPLIMRHWRDGDWMRPLGMGGRIKKLSDLFTDLKYSLPEKERTLILASPEGERGHALAVLGKRVDESVKVREGDNVCYRIIITHERV